MFFFLKKTPKQELISKAEKTYKKDLDIVNIVTKLHDLEKLKILLLDENQLVLFNYLSKPTIDLTNENIFNYDNLRNSERKIGSLFSSKENLGNLVEKSYKTIWKNQNLNTIDKKLIDLFDERMCKWKLNQI